MGAQNPFRNCLFVVGASHLDTSEGVAYLQLKLKPVQ